jgi:hypothetical protein
MVFNPFLLNGNPYKTYHIEQHKVVLLPTANQKAIEACSAATLNADGITDFLQCLFTNIIWHIFQHCRLLLQQWNLYCHSILKNLAFIQLTHQLFPLLGSI